MRKILISMCIAVSLVACDSDTGETLQNSINTASPAAIFSPTTSEVPFPTDLLFQGTTDGSLNIPADLANPADAPIIAMNALDGFSTVAPISTEFGSAIDAATITGNVRVFEVTTDNFFNNPAGPPTFAVTSITAPVELTFGVDFFATVSAQTTLVILPLKPLKPKQGYAVVITNGLTNTSGVPFKADTTYALAKQDVSTNPVSVGGVSQVPALDDASALSLFGLQQLVNAAEGVLDATVGTLDAADIILSWSFTTQSTSDVLNIVKAEIPASPVTSGFTIVSAPVKTALLAQGLPVDNVDIYTGTLDVPYYQDKTDPFAGSWKGLDGNLLSLLNGKDPEPTETLAIPVLITVPSGLALDLGSIPVTIFQHGITGDRTNALALANTLAAVGTALVAIDLPLHGVTDNVTPSPFYDAANERTFNLDVVTQDAQGSIIAATPDGVIDSSGRHFINLTSLLTSRDNVRQAVSDLFTLTNAIAGMDVGSAGADFDAANVSFIGHSLGGIVGVPFLALETSVNEAVLAMAGGGIPKILDGSAAFGPEIEAGLAANGVIKGTADYESFMGAVQTVIDSADPINYGADAAANHNVLFFEIIGGAGSPSDLVVPNTVPDANDTSGTVASLLSGTEPLIGAASMNLTATSTSGASGDLAIKFTGGHHGSLLTPLNISGDPNVSGSASVLTEMHTNLSSYIGSGGTVTILDPDSVVQIVP